MKGYTLSFLVEMGHYGLTNDPVAGCGNKSLPFTRTGGCFVRSPIISSIKFVGQSMIPLYYICSPSVSISVEFQTRSCCNSLASDLHMVEHRARKNKSNLLRSFQFIFWSSFNQDPKHPPPRYKIATSTKEPAHTTSAPNSTTPSIPYAVPHANPTQHPTNPK
ncbi:hypothetical protein BDW59DRAFT_114729 [Aspergillus cavernicola]|uniref:Uncharacterized protein n=1 Tax=Aspergillus cavernicola TaxID=176166 RepID=A0ABR4IWA8_9EURO